jgi:hypothetical protein
MIRPRTAGAADLSGAGASMRRVSRSIVCRDAILSTRNIARQLIQPLDPFQPRDGKRIEIALRRFRARNLWNGLRWVSVRFCSTHCEALYELERYDANAHRWRALLARPNPQS